MLIQKKNVYTEQNFLILENETFSVRVKLKQPSVGPVV